MRLSVFGRRIGQPSAMTKRAVYLRDGHRCGYCGTTTAPLELDHIVPVLLGGVSVAGNLTPACGPCNRGKGATLTQTWLRRLERHGGSVTVRNVAAALLDAYTRNR